MDFMTVAFRRVKSEKKKEKTPRVKIRPACPGAAIASSASYLALRQTCRRR